MKTVKLFENETYKGVFECVNVEKFNTEYIKVKVQYWTGIEWVEVETFNTVSPKYQKGLFKRLNETYNA